MANNRLFLVDSEDGSAVLLATSDGERWRVFGSPEKLQQFLDEVTDRAALGPNTGGTSLQLVTELDEVTPPEPVTGKWYWVRRAAGPWFIAMRDPDALGGWSNADTWEDFDRQVKVWVPIHPPVIPQRQGQT